MRLSPSIAMRAGALLPLVLMPLLLASCSGPEPDRPPSGAQELDTPRTQGETRGRVAPHGELPATFRSGPQVPARLPDGITAYPGARIVDNTVVERGGAQQMLLVAETRDPVARVTEFYREELRRAGMALTLDIGAERHASLGGTLPAGGGLVIAIREEGGRTRIEISAS